MREEPKGKRRWLRWIGMTLIALLGLVLLTVWVGVPLAVKAMAPRIAGDHVKGQMEIGWVWINPLTATVTVDDLTWSNPIEEEIIGFERLRVDLDPVDSLLIGELRVKDLDLAGLRVELMVDEAGSLNLLESIVEKPPREEVPQESELPAIWFGRIALRQASVEFIDLSRSRPFRKVIAPINFKMNDLHTGPEREVPLELTALTEDAEEVEVSGTVGLNPLRIDATLTANDVQVSEYSLFVGADDEIDTQSGLLDARITFSAGKDGSAYVATLMDSSVRLSEARFLITGPDARAQALLDEAIVEGISTELRLDETEGISLAANARVELTSMRAILDDQTDSFFQVNTFRIEGIGFDLASMALRAGEIAIDQPAILLERNTQGNLALLGLLPAAGPQAGGVQEEGESAPLNVSVSRIHLDDGLFRFRDASVEPATELSLGEINLKIEPLDIGTGNQTAASLSATIQETGNLAMDGTLSLPSYLEETEVTLAIKEVSLPSLSAYSAAFTGRPIEAGSLSADTEVTITDANLNARNAMRVQSIQFGTQVEGYTGATYPLETAIAVLQNKDGRMDINIPVSGSLNDPSFHPSQAFINFFSSLLVKSATMPLTIATSMTGGVLSGIGTVTGLSGAEQDETSIIEFLPGLTKLAENESASVSAIADTLKNRPRMQLLISGSVDPVADRTKLIEARFDKQLARFDGKDREAKIRSAYVKEIALVPDIQETSEGAEGAADMADLDLESESPAEEEASPDAGTPETGQGPSFYLADGETRTPPMRPVSQPPVTEDSGSVNTVEPGTPSEPTTPAEPGNQSVDTVMDRSVPGPPAGIDLPDVETMRDLLAEFWFPDDPDLNDLAIKRAERVMALLRGNHAVPENQLMIKSSSLQEGAYVHLEITALPVEDNE